MIQLRAWNSIGGRGDDDCAGDSVQVRVGAWNGTGREEGVCVVLVAQR